MTSLSEIDEVRYQRDIARAKAEPLERENARLRMLLAYAEEAIMAEYRLRFPTDMVRQWLCSHRVYFDDLKRINDDLVEATCHRCDKKLSAPYGLALDAQFDGWRPRHPPQPAEPK
jgi:hypothetical protein